MRSGRHNDRSAGFTLDHNFWGGVLSNAERLTASNLINTPLHVFLEGSFQAGHGLFDRCLPRAWQGGSTMRVLKRLLQGLECVLVCAVVLVAAASLIPRLFGYTPYAVLSGSMEPDLPVGSLVYVKSCDPSAIAVGDTATFYRSDGAVVTHQVYEIDAAAQTIGTQGIANKDSDGSIMHDAEKTPFSRVIGTTVFCVPYLGYVNAYCATPPGLFVVIAILVLLGAAIGLLDGKEDEGCSGRHTSR